MVDQPFPFTLQIYTPNSDIAAGFTTNQLIWSRAGNDTLLGFQPLTPTPGQTQIDFLIGDVAIDDPAFRQWNDTFILGDWLKPYYANGTPSNFGVNDFGLIADFNPALDTIQLYGNANNYQLLDVGVGTALLQQKPTGPDVIGFLLGNSNLSLASNYFNYRGITPPPGPVLRQTKQLGTAGFELTTTTATDPSGNVYIAGGTTGSLGGLNNGDSRDALVTKYDRQGNVLFSKQIGTSDFDTIYGIDTDGQGNFYVAGITAGDLGGSNSEASTDAFVAKYDSNGNQLWIQQFGRNLIFQTFSIDVDDNGNAFLSGIDVKSSPDLATDDFWVAKYDTNGNRQWFTETGSVDAAFDESYAVTSSNDGSVYAAGWTLGDLAAPNTGVYDAWIGKFDNNGGREWLRQFGTTDYEWTWGLDTDSQGNVYATGWTLGDLGGQNAGSYDPWLAKYDKLGNQLWLRQFGSSGDDQAFRLNIDANDNIFLTGYTNGNLGGNNAGSFDAWVARYDTDGNQQWLQQFGTPDLDQSYGITSDNAGNIFVTGVTQGSFGASNAGSFDSWLAKLDAATGNLQSFGTQQPVTSLSTLNLLGTRKLSNPSGQLADQTAIDYITNFFQDFTTNTLGLPPGSGGPNGTGLEVFLRNPYGQPASVAEPAAGVGLLLLAAVSMLGARLKGRMRCHTNSL